MRRRRRNREMFYWRKQRKRRKDKEMTNKNDRAPFSVVYFKTHARVVRRNEKKFKITVDVRNHRWGKLFGYKGTFDAKYISIASPAQIPQDVLPVREEQRE